MWEFPSLLAPLHLLSVAIWLIPSHAYSSVSVHITVYSFYRPAGSNICSKGPRNWFRGWNPSISNPAPTQGYISFLEDWHMVPICISDNISLPGTDVHIAPKRCNLMMDRNNLIIQTFVFVNPTWCYRQYVYISLPHFFKDIKMLLRYDRHMMQLNGM